MKTKIKPIEECAALLEIEIPKETIDKANEARKKANDAVNKENQ